MAELENSKDLISVLVGQTFFVQKWTRMNIKIIYWELFFINIYRIHF